jgi:general secretion pathway protein G
MNARRTSRGGFTLVEILLVIAIIGILAGVFIFAVGDTQDKAKKDTTVFLIDGQVCPALERYKLHIGEYPGDADGGLDALIKKPSFTDEKLAEKWAGPYLNTDPVDGWGNKLGYQPSEPGSEEAKTLPYKVWSFGPNKQDDNGAGDDIKNKAWIRSEAQTK